MMADTPLEQRTPETVETLLGNPQRSPEERFAEQRWGSAITSMEED